MGAPDVLETVRLRHRQRQRDLVRTGRNGCLGPFQVRHEHRNSQIREGARKGHNFRGIGQLRQQLRRHEATDLDLGDARGGLGGDPRLFGLKRHDALHALQPISRTDLTNQYATHVTPPGRSTGEPVDLGQ